MSCSPNAQLANNLVNLYAHAPSQACSAALMAPQDKRKYHSCGYDQGKALADEWSNIQFQFRLKSLTIHAYVHIYSLLQTKFSICIIAEKYIHMHHPRAKVLHADNKLSHKQLSILYMSEVSFVKGAILI